MSMAHSLVDLATKATSAQLVIIVGFVSFCVYFNALFNGFVYDDMAQVIQNPWIRNVKYLPNIFTSNVWGFRNGVIGNFSNYYRPLMHVANMLTYHAVGLSPWAFHLVNLVFHTGVSILALLVSKILFEQYWTSGPDSKIAAFAAAILFATHPIHTEAVTWIASFPEISFAFFFLLSFYFFIRSRRDGTLWNMNYFFSLVFFFLSTLCKESALTSVVLIIIFDCLYKSGRDNFSERLTRYLPYMAILGAYLAIRSYALGGLNPLRTAWNLDTYQHTINSLHFFTLYLGKLFLPMNLNAFHVFHPLHSVLEWKVLLSIIFSAAFLVFGVLALKRNKLILLSLLFIVIPLLPVLYIPLSGVTPFAERYLYLPSLGFVMLASMLLTGRILECPPRVVAVAVLFVTITGIYSFATIRRNFVWRDNYTLWVDTARKSPDCDIPNARLGEALLAQGRIDEAIERFNIVLRINPFSYEIYQDLGNAYFEKGLVDEAIKYLEFAVRIFPGDARVRSKLGLAYETKGLTEKAVEQHEAAARLNPAPLQ